MDQKARYRNAMRAADAAVALSVLDTAADLLEKLPHIDARLQRLESSVTERLRKERNRMLDVMDAAHKRAGVAQPATPDTRSPTP
jgi:uncharacterized protein involved in exopolysaccharide biosynthesis